MAGMAEYRNPAGRLHDLLARFAEQRRMSTGRAWSIVLEVDEDDVPMHLGDVASLVRDVRDAARETGLDAFDPIPAHLTTLSRSIFPITEPFGGRADNVAPNPAAMEALKMLSAYLERQAPEGKMPGEAELDELRASVQELIQDVTTADLPVDIKRELLHRLGDVLGAIEHLKIGGPDAVRRAAESLAITALLYEEEAEEGRAVFSRLKSFARRTWVVFTVTTSLASAMLTWDRIADLSLLDSSEEQRQLPPPVPTGPSNTRVPNDEQP